jgi:hypothetical protein
MRIDAFRHRYHVREPGSRLAWNGSIRRRLKKLESVSWFLKSGKWNDAGLWDDSEAWV